MGTLYKRGKTYWIQYYYNGRKIRESARTNKKMVARKFLEQREGKIAEGRLPGIYFDRVTFEELAEDFINDYEINGKRSIARARQNVELHLGPFFGNLRAPQITTDRIKHYVKIRMDEGATNATINRELSALKRMFNLAARQTPPKIDRVPFIPMLQENNTRKGFFEHEEFIRLREALPDYLKGFVTFAYKTGWRIGELRNLTWNQVDRKEWIVRLEPGTTKNKAGRTVYLDDELREVFREQFRSRRLDCSYVFNYKGRRVGIIRRAWATACRNAGLDGKLFHDLRRTAIRNMVRAGIPERVAMMISGHKTRSVFERYNIVSNDDLKKASLLQACYIDSKYHEA